MTDSEHTTEQIITLQNSRLERMRRNLEIFISPTTPKNSEYVLRKKLNIFDGEYTEFRNTHDLISTIIAQSERENNEYFTTRTQEGFDEIYFQLLTEIDEALLHVQREVISTKQAKIKLPVLKPPTFSGKYIDWNAFSDQFDALIHNNADVPPVQKMQYLLSALEGPAADIIKHLPVTTINYEPARELLKKKFENKRAIFINAMVQLLSFQPHNNENIENLQRLATIIHETTQSLKNITITSSETILAYLMIEKLPTDTRKEFEKQAVESEELPTIKNVNDRIHTTIRTLEMMAPVEKPQLSHQSKQSNQKTVKSFHFTKEKATTPTKSISQEPTKTSKEREMKCALCSQEHSIRNCSKFLEMPIQDRLATTEQLKLCYNCLSNNHIKPKCQSRHNCFYCGGRHHSLIHTPKTPTQGQSTSSSNTRVMQPPNNLEATTSKAMHVSNLNYDAPIFRSTLLSTAYITVEATNGLSHTMRALIDMGGEASALTEDACQILQLRKHKCAINIDHLDDVQSKSLAHVEYTIQSKVSSFKTNVSALVLKSLVRRLPSREIHYANWPHIADLQLADPNFNRIGPIDMILGAKVYAEIVLPNVIRGPKGTPTAQKTELGWILFGKAYENKFLSDISINTIQIDDLLKNFFEIEEIGTIERSFSDEDQYVIEFFKQHFRRDEHGRCMIKLPFKTSIDPTAVLGKSRENALRQFLQLEKTFARNPNFKAEYVKNMNDYLLQGHMIELHDTESDRLYYTEDGTPAYDCYYLPHHAVIKDDSTTTHLRPVYNASKPSSNGNSLNSILFKGPIFLNDLIAILLNWRFHEIAFVCDIQQMYRQIRVYDSDITYQRILMRNDPSEPIKEYGINRLSFGLNYAPSGAIHTINTIAQQSESQYPETAETIKRDTYVDDNISGSHDVPTALRLQDDMIKILSSAGFNLKKWASNSEEILLAVPEGDREIKTPFSLNPDKKIKTLGISWNTSSDSFNFNVNYDNNKTVTKRFALSTIAKIYDPLGLVSPVVVKSKILMKKLWLLKLDWNDILTPEILLEWNDFTMKLLNLPSIKIPRWIHASPNCISIQIHGFSDASMKAYGASIYLRCIDNQNEISSHLIISKSKVAPSKPITIPRLELCAALMLTKLMKYVLTSIRHHQFDQIDTFFWCDSQVVLHWINGDSNKWKTFVSNRIGKIQRDSQPNQWN